MNMKCLECTQEISRSGILNRTIVGMVVLLMLGVTPHPGESRQSSGSESDQINVMILGSPHFGNPGQDVINIQFPDVMQPGYQQQIGGVINSLAEFSPSKVALEVRPDSRPRLDSLYKAYQSGAHQPTRNETQQIGFKLAGRMNHSSVYGIDREGEFPFGEVIDYAEKHQPEFIDYFQSVREDIQSTYGNLYEKATIREILLFHNSEENLSKQRNYYAQTAPVGDDTTWVGAELVTKWHERNIKIFAELAWLAEPGDNIVVVIGSGHAPLLRYFVESSKEMNLVEPKEYL